jgi:hypothetical protein
MCQKIQNKKLKCRIRNFKLYKLFNTLRPNLKRYFNIPYNESKHNILALVGNANEKIDSYIV